MAAAWLPVRRILRAVFGPDGYQILRTGEIRVRRGDGWERVGSLTDPSTLDALRCTIRGTKNGTDVVRY